MKVSAADDVSSRVQPQLAATTGQTPAQQPGAGQLAQELDGQQPQQQTQQAQQQAQQEQQAPRHTGRGGSHPLPPAHYVLSLDELQEHGYPLPRFDEAQGEMVCPEGFVATRATKGEVVPCAGDTGWLSASWRGRVRVGERARRWLRGWMGVG